jgi:hypothetical protein
LSKPLALAGNERILLGVGYAVEKDARSVESASVKIRYPQRKRMLEENVHTAPTLFLLMAQYNGQTVVPLDQICRDFFGHLTVEKLLRKALRGDIALPIVRIETSQKAQRGVHLVDLAAYIDKRRAAAVKECHQLTGQL